MYSDLLNVPGDVDTYLFRRRSLFSALFCGIAWFFLERLSHSFQNFLGLCCYQKGHYLPQVSKSIAAWSPCRLTEGTFMPCFKLYLIYTVQHINNKLNIPHMKASQVNLVSSFHEK